MGKKKGNMTIALEMKMKPQMFLTNKLKKNLQKKQNFQQKSEKCCLFLQQTLLFFFKLDGEKSAKIFGYCFSS